MTQHYYGRKIVVAWEEERNGEPGYAVKYRDGYRSWCPKAKFEEDNIALGHAPGSYPYEVQLVMARVAEIDVRLLEIATEEGDTARLERDCLKLLQDILVKRVEAYDAEREQPLEQPAAEGKQTIAADGAHKPYFVVPLADFKDFNFFRAAASTVPPEKEIKFVRLVEVTQDGASLIVHDGINGFADGNVQIAGRLDNIGIFNVVIDRVTGNINSATRPSGTGTFAGVVFALEVEWEDSEEKADVDDALLEEA